MTDFASVRDKVAIVTGASRGIGEAIAKVYADNGMKVVCANRNAAAGQAVVDAIKKSGGEAVFKQTDCSKPDEIKALVDFAVEYYGGLDGVVSNSGIGMGGTPLHEYALEDWEKIQALNLEGVFAGMKYGAEAMLKGKRQGFLINVASIAGLLPQRGQALYTATKFAVVGMTRSASLDYAPHNITVNAICPGYTLTSMFDDIPDDAMEFFLADCPSGRMGKPEECAYLALFLASDLARYISGTAIAVDGALCTGSKNVISWQHPEILTGEKVVISSHSKIAAIMEVPAAAAIVEKYFPGFAQNEKTKQAYGTTFRVLCKFPMAKISKADAQKMFDELDAFSK